MQIEGSSRIPIPYGNIGPDGGTGPVGGTGATGSTGSVGNQGIYGLGITHSYIDPDGNFISVQGIDVLNSGYTYENFNVLGITLETDHTGVLPETKFTITGVRGITGGDDGVTLPNEYYDIRNYDDDGDKTYPIAGFFKTRNGKTAFFKNIVTVGNSIKIEEDSKVLQIIGATSEVFYGSLGNTGALLYLKEDSQGQLRAYATRNTIWGVSGNDVIFARVHTNREIINDTHNIPSHGEHHSNYNYNTTIGQNIKYNRDLHDVSRVKSINHDGDNIIGNFIPVHTIDQYSYQSTNYYEAFPHLYMGISGNDWGGVEQHMGLLNKPSFYSVDDERSVYNKIELGSCCFCKTDPNIDVDLDLPGNQNVPNIVTTDCIESVSKKYCNYIGGNFDTVSCLYRTDDDGIMNPYCATEGACCVNGACIKANRDICEGTFGGYFFWKDEQGEFWTCEKIEQKFGECPITCPGEGACCLPGGMCVQLNCLACGLIPNSICLEGYCCPGECGEGQTVALCCNEENNFGACCVDEVCFDGVTPQECVTVLNDGSNPNDPFKGNPGIFKGIGTRCIVSVNQEDGKCDWIEKTPFKDQIGCYFEVNPTTGEELQLGLYQKEEYGEWVTYSCCSDNEQINYDPILGACCVTTTDGGGLEGGGEEGGGEVVVNCLENSPQIVCEELDGIFLGENVSCDNSPCLDVGDGGEDYNYGICCHCSDITGYCTCIHQAHAPGETPSCELDSNISWTFYSAEVICGEGNVDPNNSYCCADALSQPCPWCSEGAEICNNLHGPNPLSGNARRNTRSNRSFSKLIKDPSNPYGLENKKRKHKKR